MPTPWTKTVLELPVANQWCFLRLSPSYGPVISGKFNGNSSGYFWQIDDYATKRIPFYMVPRWKDDPSSGTTPPVISNQNAPWRYTVSDFPSTDQLVWIRVPGFYGEPVFARFKTSTVPWSFWIYEDPTEWVPFYMAPRWKPYP